METVVNMFIAVSALFFIIGLFLCINNNSEEATKSRLKLIVKMCHLSNSWENKQDRNYLTKISDKAVAKICSYDESIYLNYKKKITREELVLGLKNLRDINEERELYLILYAIMKYDGGNENQQKLLDLVNKKTEANAYNLKNISKIYNNRIKANIYRTKEQNDYINKSQQSNYSSQSQQNSYSNQNNQYKGSYGTNPRYTELCKAYTVLGLSEGCTKETLEKQKRKLLKTYHPDRYATQGDNAVRMATEKCKEITQAYETICKYRELR